MNKRFTILKALSFVPMFLVLLLSPFATFAADEVVSAAATTTTVSPFDDPNYVGPKIIVNIAARRMRLYEGNQLLKEYPVAVGVPAHKTPTGERSMKMIVWNPWWLPPDSPWAAGAQDTPPGPNNPLGPVKMDLGEAILMHGTNKPGSVGHAASHGCMRMHNQEAKDLAQFIQQRYTDKTDPALFETYQKKSWNSFYVPLTTPIPVKIVYETVEVADGHLNVYPDVYGRAGKRDDVIKDKLAAAGYQVDDLNTNLLKQGLKSGRGRDVAIAIDPLFDPNLRTATATAKGDKGSAALAIIQ
jgi:L,D-transpeptidase ErfK/SrfK